MAHVDDQRVAHVLDALEAQHPGAQLLVNDPWSIYYLTGFYADMLSLIHISEPTRQAEISYAVFCLKKKKKQREKQ